MPALSREDAIRALVRTAVEVYAADFTTRHRLEHGGPNGTLNMKIHNVFIAALGPEIQYYTALVRSLDSSLGTMLERLAVNIARLSFDVRQRVEGPLGSAQTQMIAELLERYKRHEKRPEVQDYQDIRQRPRPADGVNKRHDSDYYLIDNATRRHYLIELKIGGDLDNKKGRSEKEAILEQFAILSNVLEPGTPITIHFATAYNRFGEGQPWNQQRVKQYFADEELLIGEAFWNFVCRSPNGYATVLGTYRECAHLIRSALDTIKDLYLGSAAASRDQWGAVISNA